MELVAVFAPLAGFLIAFLFGKQIGAKGAQFVTCTGLILAAMASIGLFYDVIIQSSPRIVHLATWIAAGDFEVLWQLRIDQLTVIMMCVINIVSACVHVYSVGYMSHDPARARFMSYLSLFTFAMLMLVTADNMLQLFFGWEGVGLASYLLIGFWNEKPSANAAAMKAFVVNRIGDFGLLLAIFTTFVVFGTVTFDAIFMMAPDKIAETFNFFGFEIHALTLICLMLFVGAVGKSAQLGLHTWLPDAMEGPTPVSALIHAATMVTAGVFLICRFSPVFEYAPFAREIVCILGATTALVAATIGLTQFDIKRVIAYSTMSQLGYMFFALGVSAYSAALFHLMTHAFFKALLFLGAGSVIHAMSNEQDMRRMGGIWKLIPTTYVLMWVGSLALAGMPFFAGYYSKDLILEAAFASGSWFGRMAFWMGLAAALMTAFYSWRLILMTFHGKPRASAETMAHVHESPNVMLIPLAVLAAGAIMAGSMFYGAFANSATSAGHTQDIKHIGDMVSIWDKDYMLGNSIKVLPENDTVVAAHHVPQWVKLAPIVAGGLGIAFAFFVYMFREGLAEKIARTFKPLHTLFYNKWYFDEIYQFLFVKPSFVIGKLFWSGDKKVVDGLGPDGVSTVSRLFSGSLSRFQTGFMFHYAFVMMIGLIGLVSWFIYRTMGS